MNRLLTATIFLFSVSALADDHLINDGEYDNVVLIGGEYFICSGALITPTLVITAGHCLNSPPLWVTFKAIHSEQEMDTYFGHISKQTGEASAVDRYWKYGSYKFSDGFDYVSHDLGLIKLKSPIPKSTARIIVTAMKENEYAMGTHVGYGEFKKMSTERKLRESQKYDFFYFRMSLWDGDSGGPVFVTTERFGAGIIGIASSIFQNDDSGFAKITERFLTWAMDVSGEQLNWDVWN